MSAASPLLPREDASDIALFFVICALCFLAALSGLAARSAYAAADSWTDRVTGQITIRVRGDDASAARAAAIALASPGVRTARALDRREAEDLLRPWLGAAGVPADLPLPHLIAAEASGAATGVGEEIDRRLAEENIDATVDDHALWSRDVERATGSAGLVALAGVGLLAATAIAVIAFATHAALLARRDIVEVLHLTGARDAFISGLFERRFLMLGVNAGASGALLAFAAAAFILFMAKQSGDRIWLLPQLSLSLADGMILGLTPLVAGLAAMAAARLTVLRSLSEMV
ncbi:MAG: cell division protein FtsX [Alphaproteobacteria bacterium]|nr:cell division protein FtsX [Alphaproteobacteria bacterium]